MDSSDVDTRLPPRKRLLAGLRKESSDSDLSLPASEIFDHIRDLINSGTSSPDEIIVASRSAALAATKVAEAARAMMIEKAIAAAKAKAVAKYALELLASISRNENCEPNYATKTGSRRKHVDVKLLYKRDRPAGRHETDKELARILHRSMNSSARNLSNAHRKHGRGGNSPIFCDKGVDIEENFVLNSKAAYSDAQHHESQIKRISVGKKLKFKQKKFRLIQSY